MKIYDIISEAKLGGASPASWPIYLRGLLVSKNLIIADRDGKPAAGPGLELSAASKKEVEQLLKDLETASAANRGRVIRDIADTWVTFTDRSKQQIKNIYKSSELKSGGEARGGGAAKKYWNDGEVAETFLGAAIYTRFIHDRNITANDIVSVMKNRKEFKTSQTGFETESERLGSSVELRISNKDLNNRFVLEYIHHHDRMAREFPRPIKDMDRTLSACASYVNESSKVLEALQQADNFPEADSIFILSDGISDQKGTKADLQIKVGETLRLLSLKANDVKQFGQVSGQTREIITRFLKTFIPHINTAELEAIGGRGRVWKKEGDEGWPEMTVGAKNRYEDEGILEAAVEQVNHLTGEAYKIAAEQIQSDIDKNPAGLVEHLYAGIIHHAQGTAVDQTMVILNPDTKHAWKELKFGPELKTALESFQMEVRVYTVDEGSGNNILRVFGRSKDAKAAMAMRRDIETAADAVDAKQAAQRQPAESSDPELLFQLRSYVQKGRVQRNIVEMGPLLKSITAMEKINSADGTDHDEQSDSDSSISKPAQIKKPESAYGTEVKDTTEILRKFFPFVKDHLGLTEFPKIELVSTLGGTFGQYQNGVIRLVAKGRHPVDIMRTMVHELIHWQQDQHDELDADAGKTGSPQEDDANAIAGEIMRQFDKEYPDMLQ